MAKKRAKGKKHTKYIFVSGGVISGIGKGVATSSIALLLKTRGYKVTALKADPYLNVDAGTLNPVEHGEVFILDDGMECDQDLGNYERFLNEDLNSSNYMTTGQVFKSILERERALGYGGKTVEFFQHPPEEIMARIINCGQRNDADIVLIEVGGTVGEYQNLLFLEANRLLKLKYPGDVLHAHVTYLPIPKSIGEMKSKPAQMSILQLASSGVNADIVLARSEEVIDEKRKEKIAISCGLNPEDIISAPDVTNIYEVPLNLEKQSLSDKLLKKLHIRPKTSDLKEWRRMVDRLDNPKKTLKLAMVGKYFTTGNFKLSDVYLSVIEALKHASALYKVKPEMTWVDSNQVEKHGTKILKGYDGIIVPGGFGSRGVEGIIQAVKFSRINKVPYLGLCYGMHMATIEFARNVVGFRDAHTTEVNPDTTHPVIHIMPEQERLLVGKDYGASMRLGSFPCKLKEGSLVYKSYGRGRIDERHRHRYEFNNKYREKFESLGFNLIGTSLNGQLVEVIELKDHPFFVATQFHPELKSRPLKPAPLFKSFIEASLKSEKGGILNKELELEKKSSKK